MGSARALRIVACALHVYHPCEYGPYEPSGTPRDVRIGAHAHFGDAVLYTVQPELYSNGKSHVDEVMIRFPDNMFQRFLKEM